MKIARFFAVILGILGVILLAGSLGFVLLSRNAPVRILDMPEGAVACSDAFAQAVEEGDLSGAAQLFYGQPDLGMDAALSDPEAALVFAAFLDRISFAYTGECYATDSGLARDASVSTLDVQALLEKLPERTQSLMNRKIADAEALTEIYDDQNQFRQELVEEILQQALHQLLAENPETVTREVTLNLVWRDGKWWAVPDQRLLQAFSGLA